MGLKGIIKKPIIFALEFSVDALILLTRVTYHLLKDNSHPVADPGDNFDALRIQEKEQFENILDRQTRQIKPQYVQHRNCPNCDSDSYLLVFSTQDLFDYVKCKVCGFVYALQMITHDARTMIYGGLTGTGMVDVCCSPSGKAADAQRFSFSLQLIRKYQQRGHLLDVGCGVGNFLHQASESGFSVDGIETHEEFRKAAREHYGIEVKTGIFEEMGWRENDFQVVTMWETLEHIYNPKAAIQKAFEILSPEGILAISVPNLANFGFLLMREYSAHRGGEHINFFSPPTLARMLTDCGFTVVERHTTDNTDWPAMLNLLNLEVDKMYCYSNVGSKRDQVAPTPFIAEYEAAFLRKIIFPFLSRYERKTGRGGGITMLAQKKV